MNQAGAGSLPPNVQAMHKVLLVGKFVLQLDEAVNMAVAARDRYTDQAGSRCLKFALTDGCQQVVGIEHCHMPSFTWDCPAGSKILIHNVPMRRGLLLLGPDNTALLGGQVERLEAARQRAVAAWNKPIMGRPPNAGPRNIFGEARQAAWAPGPPAGQQPPHPPRHQQQQAAPLAAPQAAPPQAAAPGQATGAAPAPSGAQAARGPPGGFGPGPAWTGAATAQPLQPHGQIQPQQPHQQARQQAAAASLQNQHEQANGRGSNNAWGQAAPAAGPPARLQQHQGPGVTAEQGRGGPTNALPNPNQWPPTQPRAPTPPTQPAASHVTGTPPDGTAATGGGGQPFGAGTSDGAGRVCGQGPGIRTAVGGVQGAPARLPAHDRFNGVASSGWNGGAGGCPITSGGSRGAGTGMSRSSEPGGSRAQPLELATSSDSGPGSPDGPSLHGASPHAPPQQPPPHWHHQQHPARQPSPHVVSAAGAGRCPGSAGASLLGGSQRPQGAPAPQQPTAAVGGLAAAALAASTSSCGLPPPGRRVGCLAQQRAVGPSGAIGPAAASPSVSGAAGKPHKPALPLARSSPGLQHGPSPSVGPAGPRPGAAPGGVHASRAAAGRGYAGRHGVLPLAPDTEVVDLASLDDDDEEEEVEEQGGSGALSGSAPGPGRPPGPAAKGPPQPQPAYPQAQPHGRKAKLPLPHDPPGGAEKKPRLSPSPEPQRSAAGSAAGAPAGARMAAWPGLQRNGQGGAAAAAAAPALEAGTQMVPATQMEVDSGDGEGAGGVCHAQGGGPSAPGFQPWGAGTATRAAGHGQPNPLDDPMAVEVQALGDDADGDGWPREGGAAAAGWPVTRADAGGSGADDANTNAAASNGGSPGVHAGAHATAGTLAQGPAHHHMGSMMVVQVQELLAELSNDLDLGLGGGGAGGGGAFPLIVDVFGVFQQVDGEFAFVEDGTGVLQAVLTDAAVEALLASFVAPDGVVVSAPRSLEEIQMLADSPDPAVQAYGQDLAARLMDYVRDFSGIIRLRYDTPDTKQPLIVQLVNEDGGGGDGTSGDGAEGGAAARTPPALGRGAASGALGAGDQPGHCAMYEQHLRGIQVLGEDEDMGP